MVLGIQLGAADLVFAYSINGYAVDNHRACRANNLPGTIKELNRFFDSDAFPETAEKNFLYTDSRVRANEWHTDGDYFQNSSTANGMDGADSALLTYIASHGGTYSAVYSALSGSKQNGGCEMKTSKMTMGDHSLRYLVLSTCQGLKIGDGDNPERRGEDPSKTWASGAKGLNCIYGYSNNMVDASGYGHYFLKNLQNSDESTVDSFFRASRQVSYSNLPAALCFGLDEENARYHLDNDRNFTHERNGADASAWTYEESKRVKGAFVVPQMVRFPKVIRTEKTKFDVKKIIPAILGADTKKLGAGANQLGFRSQVGTVIVDEKSGVLHFLSADKVLNKVFELEDEKAIRLARTFLARKNLAGVGEDLVPSYLISKGTSLKGEKIITHKTVVFHQKLNGVMPLGTAGSYEVKIASDGSIVKAIAAPLNLGNLRKPTWMMINDATLIGERVKIAKARLAAKFGKASIKMVDIRFGYDTNNSYESQDRSRAVVEALFEVDGGKYSRRYVEKVPL